MSITKHLFFLDLGELQREVDSVLSEKEQSLLPQFVEKGCIEGVAESVRTTGSYPEPPDHLESIAAAREASWKDVLLKQYLRSNIKSF